MLVSGGVYPNMPPITRKGEYKTMRRRTTTKQRQNVIKNNLLTIEKAEVYHKTSRETETIPNDKFLECFDFFCESGIFMDCIGWHYDKNLHANGYIIECGRYNPHSENIITAYLEVADSATEEEIEKMLLFEESGE